MKNQLPAWLDPSPWLEQARLAASSHVQAALEAEEPAETELAALLSPAASEMLEVLAQRARELTRHRFGHNLALFIPLYLSDFCSGGCQYCGFAADRAGNRKVLDQPEVIAELAALKAMGFEEVLLLTGERNPQADVDYLESCVRLAAERFHRVMLEAFSMTVDEYRRMGNAGCTGVTLYQETYHPKQYERMHRWGEKCDYVSRLQAPERILASGIRTVGLGALLGLADPLFDALALYRHARHLQHRFWQSGITISFPRICPEAGGFIPPHPVDERFLTQMICAFRICWPDVPLVISTREKPSFRDGIAGIGITKMSVASRTTVGGYHDGTQPPDGQFQVHDHRDTETFCSRMRAKGLEPVFKDWDAVYR